MERLDFASVMKVIHNNIREELRSNQTQLLTTLFWDMLCDTDPDRSFDEGQVSKWMSGLARLSPKILKYYQENINQRKLAATIETQILPMMPDPAMAVQELYDLLMQAPNVSPQMKQNLTEGFSFEDRNEEAVFITDVLCLAMQLRYEKRDIRTKALRLPESRSPVVQSYIYDGGIPKPCRWFVGRDAELEQLHDLLIDNSKVFVHGIPGIGKSELVKAYASRYGEEYTNILYLYYEGDLIRTITDLNFADDRPDDLQTVRFQRHDLFLRSLKEDTLLVVDNFNVPESGDGFLDVLMRYRCRILFTTRCRYEERTTMEVRELPADTLLELMGKFYDLDRETIVFREIIELLHRHTFAVELAARLLCGSMLRPKALLKKLKIEKMAMDVKERIRGTKDGSSKRATYYDHIHTLFSLYRLSRSERKIMRCMIFLPEKGVPLYDFGKWMDLHHVDPILDLIEIGLVQFGEKHEVSLHPIIRDVALEELSPSVRNCAALLYGIQTLCLHHGMELPGYKQLFRTVENMVAWIRKDDLPMYLLFLENVFQYMEKYRYVQGMETIVKDLEEILKNPRAGTTTDRALLLDCKAACVEDPREAIRLEEEALRLLGPVTPNNSLFLSNLHANLGGLYHNCGDLLSAKAHMEQGISALERYPVAGYHDMVLQVNNYAAILAELGEPQRGYDAMVKLAGLVQAGNSDRCLDYGLVQQTMGSISLTLGDPQRAKAHFAKALEIFQLVFEEEPQLLEQKRREIARMALLGGAVIAMPDPQ